jgi:ribonuclease HI
MYPSKEPNHVGKGETWFFVSESLVVKEVFENQINSNTIVEDSKMKKEPQELKVYKHKELMKELNDMMIRIKRYLFRIPGDTRFIENEELDSLTNKLMAVLREDSEPMIKY